jgi:hypothetical protein
MFHTNVVEFDKIYNSIGIAMGYRLDSQGSNPSRSKSFFSAPQHLDQL